jgi:hypothetical protein
MDMQQQRLKNKGMPVMQVQINAEYESTGNTISENAEGTCIHRLLPTKTCR